MNIFHDLYNESTDLFWKSIFKEFASGDTIPFEISMTDTCISSDTDVVEYKDKDVSEVLSKVKLLFTNTLVKARSASVSHEFSSWKKVKKKSTRQAILLHYLIEHGGHLPYKEILALYKLLVTAITFKLITHEDIVMNGETCKIDRINGVNLQSKNPITIHMGNVPIPPINSASGTVPLFK